MDWMSIMGLISKGITIAQMAIEAGKSAAPAIEVVKKIVTGAQQENITDEELLALEVQLDQQIAEFNEPI